MASSRPGPDTAREARRASSTSRRAAYAVVVLTLLVCACGTPAPEPMRLPEAPPWWVAGMPLSHVALTRVLAGGPDDPEPGGERVITRPGAALTDLRLRALRGYLAVLAEGGPGTNPEVFPTDRDVLAYFLNAHVAWAVLLNAEPSLRRTDVGTLRRTPFPLGRSTTTLERLEGDILRRWSTEPRTVLMMNPGWRGGPPLPAAAVEAHAVAWQLAEHAALCGRAPGFWSFDSTRKALAVSAYTSYMPGLPSETGRRVRRLLDLIPPPPEMAPAVLATCGDALQRCTISFTPVDQSRLEGDVLDAR